MVHDCPYCHCDERPECAEGHCLHAGVGSHVGSPGVWVCCRCPHKEPTTSTTETANASWPPPGCKLEIRVT